VSLFTDVARIRVAAEEQLAESKAQTAALVAIETSAASIADSLTKLLDFLTKDQADDVTGVTVTPGTPTPHSP
jgi:hypothetical protein